MTTDRHPPVLIVESEPDLARRLARAFEPALSPHVVSTHEEAMAWLDANVPRGAVVDLDIRAGSTLDVVRELRRRHPTAPCLALVGTLVPDLVDEIESLGTEIACTQHAKASVGHFAREVAVLLHTRDDRVARSVAALAQARGLTIRQTEILTMAVERFDRDATGRQLGITVNTLKTATRSLLDKTGGATLGDIAWHILAACREPATVERQHANLWQPTRRKAWP